jgi:hypothetical protein
MPGARVEPAGALCEKWYSYLGLRLRLQHGELPTWESPTWERPDCHATARFSGEV